MPTRSPSTPAMPGELTDPSGLVYLRARWYDPAVGRFTTTEPLAGAVGVPASLNRCLYAHARPTALTDPDGLDPKRRMCTELSKEITHRRNLLSRQAQNLREDPLQLGPRDRLRHEKVFTDLRTQELLDSWSTSGCDNMTGIGIPGDVRSYATQSIPAAVPRALVTDDPIRRAGAVAIGVYMIYRVVRFLPSLLPPLWPTLVPNALVP